MGKPKSRWEDDVRNDLRKTKLIKWAEQVQDRLKWKDVVEKAKTLVEEEEEWGGGGEEEREEEREEEGEEDDDDNNKQLWHL